MASNTTKSHYTASDGYESDQTEHSSASIFTGDNSDPLGEKIPRYVPPGRRRVNLDQGDFVVVDDPEKRDATKQPDEQGNANRKYPRLLHRVNFSLTQGTTRYLTGQFPGLFFVTAGHENHSHPCAHVMSDVAHRFALRRLSPGSRILEIGGIPKKAREFNRVQLGSQRGAKHLDVLVDLWSPKDFRRLIDKWGPQYTWDEERNETKTNYHKGRISDMSPEFIQQYDVFLFHHTGYYHTWDDYMHIFRCNQSARIVITTLKHDKRNGTLCNGELSYQSLPHKAKGIEIVKQVNVHDGETYCHPNIYKQFALHSSQARRYCPEGSDLGLSWEITPDSDDHYTIQMSSYLNSMINKSAQNDWEADFLEAEADSIEANFVDLSTSRSKFYKVLPTPDGHFVELNVTHPEMVEKLVVLAAGKSRHGEEGEQLLQSMFNNAKTLVSPGSLFPGIPGLSVAPLDIADHVVCAFVSGIEKETDLLSCIESMRGAIRAHAKVLTPAKARISRTMSLEEGITILRQFSKSVVKAAIVVNSARGDRAGASLKAVDSFL